jgi:hypothetical protein
MLEKETKPNLSIMKNTTLLFGLLFLVLLSCNNDDDMQTIDTSNKNLVAYFPFNGNAIDQINLENTSLVKGAILSTDNQGIDNSAFRFNGIDDIIEINHSAALNLTNEFTISALVNPEEIKSQTIIRKGAAVNGIGTVPYGLSMSATGAITFTATTENGATINHVSKQGYQINQWYLITGVLKDSEMFLYVNGVLEDSVIINGESNTNSFPLLIGSRLRLESNTFKGVIDEVRLYNVALTESEILALQNNL